MLYYTYIYAYIKIYIHTVKTMTVKINFFNTQIGQTHSWSIKRKLLIAISKFNTILPKFHPI